MAKKLGNDYWLWVESTTPGTYNFIKGQGTLSIKRAVAKFDIATKDDSGLAAQAYGLASQDLDFECIPNLPDATGYGRIETLSTATPRAAFLVQIRKGAQTGGTADVVWAGSVYANIDETNFGQNAGTGVKISMSATTVTTDALA